MHSMTYGFFSLWPAAAIMSVAVFLPMALPVRPWQKNRGFLLAGTRTLLVG